MERETIIKVLDCCSHSPRKCLECPLRDTTNCMYVTRREAILALKGSTETREARWKGAGMGDYYCSLCQHTMSGRTKFCPECGAKMDKWEEDEA